MSETRGWYPKCRENRPSRSPSAAPSEPDEEESRQRRRHKKSKNEENQRWVYVALLSPLSQTIQNTNPSRRIYMNLKHTFTLAPTQHMISM